MEGNELLVVSLLTFVGVLAIGAAILISQGERRQRIETRLKRLEEDDLSDLPPDQDTAPKRQGALARIAGIFAAGKPSESLRAQLAMAGFHDVSAASVYLGAKMLLLLGGTIGAAALSMSVSMELPSRLLLALSCGMLLSFLPNLVVKYIRQKRMEEIRRHLPDAVDLLEICVSAGMGMDMAWNAVSDEIRGVSQLLADEMALTNLEMHLGASRTVAMRHMVHRTGAEDLGSLVAVLVQSERFGTSMAEALKVFAGSMREARSQRAEEAAEKLPLKMLFPLVLLIFPALMIVLIGPAFIRIFEFFGSR